MFKRFIFYFLMVSLFVIGFQSCHDDDDDYRTYPVSVQLAYPDDYTVREGVSVTLTNTGNSTVYNATTNAEGVALFAVPDGVYEASATERRSEDGKSYNFNGIKNFTVTKTWTGEDPVVVDLSVSEINQLVIKELYVGGCQKDDGSGNYHMDKYVILYNNSEDVASLDHLCLGMGLPYNANTTNQDYVGDALFYEAEGWIPAGNGIWYFQGTVSIEPGEQLVIAMNNAIDNTVTYSNSINFANASYYCTYDIEDYYQPSYYAAPSELIPTSHYLLAIKYGPGSGWSLSNNSPAFFIFNTEGVTPEDFATNTANYNYHGGGTSQAQIRAKVPVEWVLDGIEVFRQGKTCYKRLTANVDAGYIYYTNEYGYTLYRNVDKDATEAIEGNSGKLVYGYSGGTTDVADGTTDPSGIDAEASIKNGARIIYKDTNNTTNDFHQRRRASLRD